MGTIVLSAVLLGLVSCDLIPVEETYSYDLDGICVEITTDDPDIKQACLDANYSKGSCSSTGVIGTCEDYSSVGGEDVDAVFYDDYTVGTAELTCLYLGGSWDPK